MKEYIITEEQIKTLDLIHKDISTNGGENDAWCIIQKIRSRPAPSPQFNSTELLLLAHDEWKRRQERKHLDDETAWVSGFIGGFITDKTWAAAHIESLRKQGEQ